MHFLRTNLTTYTRTEGMQSKSAWLFGSSARAILMAASLSAAGCDGFLGGEDETERNPPVDDTSEDSGERTSKDARPGDAQDEGDADDADRSHADDDAEHDVGSLTLALSTTEGAAPLYMEARPPVSADEALTVLYDWGEGAGPEESSAHLYVHPGDYIVTQEVHDPSGAVVATTSEVVHVISYPAVRWSDTDKSPCSKVSPDGTMVESRDWGPCGTRTSGAIEPRSGVFYFEAKRVGPSGGGVGLATAAASLTDSVGSKPESMGILGWGPIRTGNAPCSGREMFNTRFADAGFVIDYRGASPVIHVISATDDESGVAVRATCTMAVSEPVFGIYSGERAHVGYEMAINTGFDTTNFPFRYGEEAVKEALRAGNAGDAADELVMGFGATRAGRPDAKPELTLSGPTVAAVGRPITISGVANDPEDGTISDKIVWTDLSTLHHLQPNATNAASYTFTATEPGRHPIRASVTDADGVTTTVEKLVEVQGVLPQRPVASVKLVVEPGITGAGIVTSANGLSAHFEENHKMGIRANQGLYGGFQYFEVLRNTPVRNMGIGVVVKEGSLNPYDFGTVPWSMSINVSNGFWHNLIGAGAYTPAADRTSPEYYGFAVDYRGQHPIVYVIVRGALAGTLELDDVWTPVYPMIYGNGGGPAGAMDMTVNFGASPFHFNPVAILGAKGAGLQLGWGAR